MRKKVLPSWSVFRRFLFAVWLARFFFNVNAADPRLFTKPNNLFCLKFMCNELIYDLSVSLCAYQTTYFFTDCVQLIHDLSSLVCSCSHSSSPPLTRAWTWLPRTWEWIPTCRSSSDPARKSQPGTWRIAFWQGKEKLTREPTISFIIINVKELLPGVPLHMQHEVRCDCRSW